MLNLPELEEAARLKWAEENTFKKSLDSSKETFHILDGPPTMNGTPGVHHVEARVFKDLVGRYKTMTGFNVPRTAGWDCHGLPVELSVADALGLKGKEAVFNYGLEKFNQKCRESVEKHQKVFEKLTHQMGYWVDMEKPWRTMDDSYIEKLWGSLKIMFDKNMLKEDFRVTPWCVSCGTGLSSHEVAQGASAQTDATVTVKFYVPDLDASMLVWTTTPWTLSENLLIAVEENGDYALWETPDGKVLTSRSYFKDETPLQEFKGSELNGLSYKSLFNETQTNAYKIVTTSFAKAEAGTGFVHLAPGYGSDDLTTVKNHGLTFTVFVGPDGVFTDGPFKNLKADHVTSQDLTRLGVNLYNESTVEHERAKCWRCKTPLIDLARPSWFLLASETREQMLTFDDNTKWHPENGRYRKWVESNVDWALTRERFWGTPLPVWKCLNNHVKLVESRKELTVLTGVDQSNLDLHRPFVDQVTFACDCGLEMVRESVVLDTWFDSGAAPTVTGVTTSDLVSEGVDQTRGWFYTMSAFAALSGQPQPFKEVLSLGLILDEHGEKMSKSKGNVVDPFELFATYGADAVRWSLLCDGSAWNERRFSTKSVSNAGAFLAKAWACAELVVSNPGKGHDTSLEQWLLGKLQETVLKVTSELEKYEVHKAGAAINDFVEMLSTKYLRHRRSDLGGVSGQVVKHCLETVAKMLAPFTPHFAEALYTKLGNVTSVHLQSFPEAESFNETNVKMGDALWELVEAGWTERARVKMRLRQPLANAWVQPAYPLDVEMTNVLKTQLNLKEVTFGTPVREVKPNWKLLGKTYGKNVNVVATNLKKATSSTLTLNVDGTEVTFEENVHYFFEDAALVTFDVNLTTDLVTEGNLSDLLRKVVSKRRELNMKATDVVTVSFNDEEEKTLAFNFKEAFAEKNCLVVEKGDLTV